MMRMTEMLVFAVSPTAKNDLLTPLKILVRKTGVSDTFPLVSSGD